MEHGSSVGGSWLTEKGKIYLDLLNIQYNINKLNEEGHESINDDFYDIFFGTINRYNETLNNLKNR
jgi:hypothetical protein